MPRTNSGVRPAPLIAAPSTCWQTRATWAASGLKKIRGRVGTGIGERGRAEITGPAGPRAGVGGGTAAGRRATAAATAAKGSTGFATGASAGGADGARAAPAVGAP